MTAPRKPQDHKKPETESGAFAPFLFTHAGKDYALATATDVLTAGYARKNRHKGQEDQLFCMLELLADEEALDAIDSMKRPEFTAFQEAFFEHIGVDLGESGASSNS